MSNRLIAATVSLTAALLAVANSTALAQAPPAAQNNEFRGPTPSYGYTQPEFSPTPPAPMNRHTSTVVEATGRAISYIMKAAADGLISEAQAKILLQEAIARSYQNRVINTETFLQRKQLLEEAREAKRLRELEKKERAVALRRRREETELYATYRLPSSVVDPLTGKISWPETLVRPEMRDVIEDIETLFAQLAEDGAQIDRMYRDPILELCDSYSDYLKRNREQLELNWNDYIDSQKLLVGLKYTAQYWPNSGAPAAQAVAIR